MHYLNVIRQLRPKYFVMENVEGILTKNEGKVKDVVMNEIRSIIDDVELPAMLTYLRELMSRIKMWTRTIKSVCWKNQYGALSGF